MPCLTLSQTDFEQRPVALKGGGANRRKEGHEIFDANSTGKKEDEVFPVLALIQSLLEI